MSKHEPKEHGVVDTLGDTYDKVSDKVATAYAAARDKAVDVSHNAVASPDATPVVALVGGLVLGVVLGALVPRSDREHKLLAPTGARITDAAKAAIEAARAAGVEALADAGISEDNLRQQASRLFEQAFKAAGTAGTAAFSAARETTTK